MLFALANCQLNGDNLELNYETAEDLASLPLACYNQEYPYKDGYIVKNQTDLKLNKENHPIFYGCFDWHSSVHGHWLLATLARRYPESELAANVTKVFDEQFTVEKSQTELAFFQKDKHYERTYGWAWFLKLQLELLELKKDGVGNWSEAMEPLADHLAQSYKTFMGKQVYPIRTGQHANTAFGMIFALDYAKCKTFQI